MLNLKEVFSKHIFPSDPAIGKLGSVDLNIFLIQCWGIPLLGARHETNLYQVFILVYGIIAVTILTCLYMVFELQDLVSSWGNLDKLSSNICASFSHLTGTIKIMNVLYRKNDIIKVIDQIRSLTKRYVLSEGQKKAFYRGELENKIPLTIYSAMAVFIGVLGMILLSLYSKQIAGQVFPYRVKFPEFLPYNIQVFYMGLTALMVGLQIVAIDYLNVTLINQTRFQINNLNIVLDETNVDVSTCINSAVQYHTIILKLRADIDEIFKYPVLLQFVTSLSVLALAGFQATVHMDLKSGIMLNFYCICLFFQLFVYCWFGNEASEQSKRLAERGYNSAWYDFDLKTKKSLVIFMINAQKPFYFTAGGFLTLSITTFSRILGKSYTYMAVLRQVYNK